MSPIIPLEFVPLISPVVLSHPFPCNAAIISRSCPSSSSSLPFIVHHPNVDLYALTGPTPTHALFALHQQPPSPSLPTLTTEPPPKIGNLFLSSCPGKKVRLNQPVAAIYDGMPGTVGNDNTNGGTSPEQLYGGRSAICRDLRADLTRAKETQNVGAVVCCLDDQGNVLFAFWSYHSCLMTCPPGLELRYLGAPWEEYCKVSADLGLAVVRFARLSSLPIASLNPYGSHATRIPMAEGFSPPSNEVLNNHLETVIKQWSLKGINVLVHCRGGSFCRPTRC
jgi:hypothetical protein